MATNEAGNRSANRRTNRAGRRVAQDPNVPSGRVLALLLGLTAAAIAGVIAGSVIMGLTARMDPPLLPEAAPDHEPVIPHPDGYLELHLHAGRFGEKAEVSLSAQATVRDKNGGSLDRMLKDAAARRGWLLHRDEMLVLPSKDLAELEQAAADLTGWLIRDATEGGEPRPPSGSTLVNARLAVEGTGPQEVWMLVGSVMLGGWGGALCLILLFLSATGTRDYLRSRALRTAAGLRR